MGAYVLSRAAMRALLARFDRGDHFDVTPHAPRHDAYSVVMRGPHLRAHGGVWVSRIPLFAFETTDSQIHPEHLGEHAVARAFLLTHHAALLRGDYVSPFAGPRALTWARGALDRAFARARVRLA
jgi:hypothetical protein